MRSTPAAIPSRAAAALAVLATLACGGGGTPAGPSRPAAAATPPPVTSFTVVSGETGQPVAGARAVVAGRDYTSDAQGRVTFEPGEALALVDVIAPGHLDRQTRLDRRDPAGRFTLWPRESATGLDDAFTSEILYTDASIGSTPVAGAVSLRRWPPSVTQVRLVVQGPQDNPEYETFDAEGLAVLTRAAAEINAAIGGAVVYQAPTTGGAAGVGVVHVRQHPGREFCNEYAAITTSPTASGTGAVVTFCAARYTRSLGTSIHELGHTFGLRHSSVASDVMRSGGRTTSVPSARERLVMQLVLQRLRGNQFPDNDRQASAAAVPEPETFNCR